MKRLEKDYYPVIEEWFKKKRKCTKAKSHVFNNASLLSADVVGWKNDIPVYACELKPYPMPVGSSGYGAIGQALMLKQYAKKIYVACVATEREELNSGPVVFWRKVMGRRSIQMLLKSLNLDFPEHPTFSDYRNVAETVFLNYFSSTGLGFLIVHEKDSKEDIDSSYDVIEVVKPSVRKLEPTRYGKY